MAGWRREIFLLRTHISCVNLKLKRREDQPLREGWVASPTECRSPVRRRDRIPAYRQAGFSYSNHFWVNVVYLKIAFGNVRGLFLILGCLQFFSEQPRLKLYTIHFPVCHFDARRNIPLA